MQSGVNNLTFQTGDINTGVWFENYNTSTNTAWVNNYASNTISATAQYSPNHAGNWYNWQSDASEDNCNGPLDSSSQAISGTLASGNTAYWDLSTVATEDHSC
jgi:hypothetical protein